MNRVLLLTLTLSLSIMLISMTTMTSTFGGDEIGGGGAGSSGKITIVSFSQIGASFIEKYVPSLANSTGPRIEQCFEFLIDPMAYNEREGRYEWYRDLIPWRVHHGFSPLKRSSIDHLIPIKNLTLRDGSALNPLVLSATFSNFEFYRSGHYREGRAGSSLNKLLKYHRNLIPQKVFLPAHLIKGITLENGRTLSYEAMEQFISPSNHDFRPNHDSCSHLCYEHSQEWSQNLKRIENFLQETEWFHLNQICPSLGHF